MTRLFNIWLFTPIKFAQKKKITKNKLKNLVNNDLTFPNWPKCLNIVPKWPNLRNEQK